MFRFFFLLVMIVNIAYAQVGEIVSLKGGSDAYLVRRGTQNSLTEGLTLEVGDNIHTEASHVTLILYPKIQMSLVKGTEITITTHMVEEAGESQKTKSLIELIKGLIRIQVNREKNDIINQKVNAQGVSFAVRGTEYEVSSSEEDAEIDVFEGEVEVTSPYVQTFVPEIVKPKEGFRYARKARSFNRRAHKERIKEAHFLKKEDIRNRWLKRKADKKARKEKRWEVREERLSKRREERANKKERERKGRGR